MKTIQKSFSSVINKKISVKVILLMVFICVLMYQMVEFYLQYKIEKALMKANPRFIKWCGIKLFLWDFHKVFVTFYVKEPETEQGKVVEYPKVIPMRDLFA